jgi:hypothetical protein
LFFHTNIESKFASCFRKVDYIFLKKKRVKMSFDYFIEAAVHEAGRVTGSAACQATWSSISATIVLTLVAILC